MNNHHKFWPACSAPEREPDAWVVWHYADALNAPCAGCVIKAEMQRRRFPCDSHVAWLVRMVGVFS